MRFRTLEIRWHDSKPISACDFQPVPFKKARPPPGPGQERSFATHVYRLATGGEDNHVRIWMVHPHIRPPELVNELERDVAAMGKKNNQEVPPPRPPRIEYLATLGRHSAPVNVVRFSPNGELIASAGDDGMIIIWASSATPQTSTYGSDLSPEEMQHEREFWKPRTTFRCTTMQVYDLAWSPTGEYIIAGSTDNTARIFTVADGNCVQEIAEHTHYVQGVAWDPLNEYIATQSSDRSMHIYRLEFSHQTGSFEAAHAVGKNTRMRHRRHPHPRERHHSRASSRQDASASGNRPRALRSQSVTSEAESEKEEGGLWLQDTAGPLTPASSSTAATSYMFPPPPSVDRAPSSRRSSFSSNAPGSPAAPYGAAAGRYGRSPSPMPPLPLPAIRTPPVRRGASPAGIVGGPTGASSSSVGDGHSGGGSMWWSRMLYGDESFTNFFRRLTFSPDGGLLMTPAGQFEDPAVVVAGDGKASGKRGQNVEGGNGTTTPVRGRKGRQAPVNAEGLAETSSSVYIYSRANFARPPVAQLPGHRKASVAVRFSPVLYELRPGVSFESGAGIDVGSASGKHSGNQQNLPQSSSSSSSFAAPAVCATIDKNTAEGGSLDIDVLGPVPVQQNSSSFMVASSVGGLNALIPPPPSHRHQPPSGILAPSPVRSSDTVSPMMSPSASDLTSRQSQHQTAQFPVTPVASKPATPLLGPIQTSSGEPQAQTPTSKNTCGGIANTGTSSVFSLGYRMLFAVATTDAIAIYDTQQAGPICLLTKLHYDEFTDLSWSPDGQCLMASSRDGYCTLITFDEILPSHHVQQHTIQLQTIAEHHSVPLDYTYSSSSVTMHQQPYPHSHSQTGAGLASGSGAAHNKHDHQGDNPRKRSEPPLTPASSADGTGPRSATGELFSSLTEQPQGQNHGPEPPKKKRRAALTRVGDIGS